MKLAEVEAGAVYAMAPYFDRDVHGSGGIGSGRAEAQAYDQAWRSLYPVRVLEVPVEHPGYARRGVRVQRLRRDDLEPDPRYEPDVVQAVKIVLPWAEWDRRYHEHVADREEAAERLRLEREREQARRQERAAREWMDRAFAAARRDLADALEVLNGASEVSDDHVTALVERRHPEGNPYLNGRATA